jgi:hypothetical protein
MAVDGLSPAREVERIPIIRDLVSPDVMLMVDINQRWDVHEAIVLAAPSKTSAWHGVKIQQRRTLGMCSLFRPCPMARKSVRQPPLTRALC